MLHHFTQIMCVPKFELVVIVVNALFLNILNTIHCPNYASTRHFITYTRDRFSLKKKKEIQSLKIFDAPSLISNTISQAENKIRIYAGRIYQEKKCWPISQKPKRLLLAFDYVVLQGARENASSSLCIPCDRSAWCRRPLAGPPSTINKLRLYPLHLASRVRRKPIHAMMHMYSPNTCLALVLLTR